MKRHTMTNATKTLVITKENSQLEVKGNLQFKGTAAQILPQYYNYYKIADPNKTYPPKNVAKICDLARQTYFINCTYRLYHNSE